MIHEGDNLLDGVPVTVVRKATRRINIRVRPNGDISLSVPRRWATLREGEAFLRSKWSWVVATRAEVLARPPPAPQAVAPDARAALIDRLAALTAAWADRLGESGVTWKVRDMKTLWGSCHIRRRLITYNLRLALATPEQVEYVVVHELTHLKVADHGPRFRALMNERLPNWEALRRALNRTAR